MTTLCQARLATSIASESDGTSGALCFGSMGFPRTPAEGDFNRRAYASEAHDYRCLAVG
jgi:hypothetical protein